MPVQILHLTDLHLGSRQLRPGDRKQTISKAERRRVIDRLTDYLAALEVPPDFACITGDITIANDPKGYEEFFDWVSDRSKEGVLPPKERIVITPGNHDVHWGVAPAERFERFFEVAKAFPHAYVPELDPALPADPSVGRGALVGGVRTRTKLSKVEVTRSEPYLLDRANEVLIFAFNSALGCGVYPDESEELLERVEEIVSLVPKGDKTLREMVTAVRDQAKGDLMVDAGLIGEDQLRYFQRLMQKLRKQVGQRFDRYTKIALLHHHVSHIWHQELELKPFESVIDAAQLKQALTQFGFDLVLHGHKHTNNVAVDAMMVPRNDARPLAPLCVVSGGTVGGHPALNERQTFKLLTLTGRAPRTTALVEEFPLVQTADPVATMATERVKYNIPLHDRMPVLHDDAPLKDRLDAMLLDDVVEADAKEALVSTSADLRLPGDREIVSQASRYVFDAMSDSGKERTYFEVILATARIDFRQRARIHWMLVDLSQFAKANDLVCSVVLVIGNLANTHFSREVDVGEIAASIDKLKRAFAPAIKSGLLDVRVRDVSQDEIEDVDRQLPVGKT